MSTEIKLTPMQIFIIQHMKESEYTEFNPSYLGSQWHKYKHGRFQAAASRRSFGTTTAAYKACRKLAEAGILQKVSRYETYSLVQNPTI